MSARLLAAYDYGHAGGQRSCDNRCPLSADELLEPHFDRQKAQPRMLDLGRHRRRWSRGRRRPSRRRQASLFRRRPLQAPFDSEERAECRRCEAKRSSCTLVRAN